MKATLTDKDLKVIVLRCALRGRQINLEQFTGCMRELLGEVKQ